MSSRPTPSELDRGRFYKPYGTAREALYAKDREVLYAGPAGTGKSRTALEKCHIVAERYAGTRQLIARKTRESLAESTLVTFETKVVPPGHPILLGASGNSIQRKNRHSYIYPNGSEIVLGGMNRTTRILSTEYDRIYVPEAIELEIGDWETLLSRLRNGVLHYQQIYGDTNPDADTHWLYQRCLGGKTRLINSQHEDNPVLFNVRTGEWTEFGLEYISTLDALTGARKQRLRYGRWVGSEGVVYDEIDDTIHRDDRTIYPGDWMRVWVIDFGYVNAFVWICWAVDHDGRIYREREIYRTRTLVEDHAKEILTASADIPLPTLIICDHDAEDRATIERHLGMPTVAAIKDIKSGIQAVKERLKVAGDGRPRLMFGAAQVHCSNPHSEYGVFDPELRRQGLPACTWEEFNVYVWDSPKGVHKDVPVKKHDHGMDNMRYAVMGVNAYLGVETDSAAAYAKIEEASIFDL